MGFSKSIIVKNLVSPDFFIKGVIWFLKEWTFKKNYYFIIARKLDNLIFESKYKLNLDMKKANEDDLKKLVKNISALGFKEKRELILRIFFYDKGFKNCFVFRDKKGEIIHIQWLIFPEENNIIIKKYKNRFQPLSKNQVMLENAYTLPSHRGLGILRLATFELMNLAKEANYKNAIGYIRIDNIKSLNEFLNMGFKIIGIIPEYKFFGRIKRIFNKK